MVASRSPSSSSPSSSSASPSSQATQHQLIPISSTNNNNNNNNNTRRPRSTLLPLGCDADSNADAIANALLDTSVRDTTVLITGVGVHNKRPNICWEVARILAKHGVTVCITSRTAKKAKALARSLQLALDKEDSETPSENLRPRGRIIGISKALDLSSADSVYDFVDEWDKHGLECVDRLILGAGLGLVPGRQRTTDRIDANFAVNHLGHFLLTNLMLDALRASKAFRVVVLGSEMHRGIPGTDPIELDLEDINCEEYTDDWEAHPPCGQAAYMSYARSKLCNVLFARQFAKNLTNLRKWAPWKGTSSVVVVDPGLTVRTGLTRHVPVTPGSKAGERNRAILTRTYSRKNNPRARSVRQAAGDVILAAFAPTLQPSSVYEEMVKEGPLPRSGKNEDVQSGGTPFWYLRERDVSDPSEAALDDEAAQDLWEFSCDLVGLK